MNKLTNFIESQQLDKELIFHLFKRADELRKNEDKDFGKGNKVKVNKSLEGKVLATLFYEPSTRTRLSFETAMLRLGGSVVSTENAKEFSSAVKGESMEDTARIVSAYADGIVIRHYEEGASARAASVSKVPILNAGDGCGQHPSQALLDVYTIYREVGKLDGVSVAMVGDLSHGRTVRSLSYLLGKFEGVKITFVSPKSFGVGQDIKEYLDKHNVKWSETESLEEVISKVDIIYLTRIQKERMTKEEYEKAKGVYCINQANLFKMKKEARLLHPLPHVEEINLPIKLEQEDKRVAYFRQAENGLYIRMALLEHLLGEG